MTSKEQRDTKLVIEARIEQRNKQLQKAERIKWFNDLIQFKILDELGGPLVDDNDAILPNSEFVIVRKNLSMDIINEFISRSPIPDLEVDFFTESETNEAFWLEDLKGKSKPKPMYYVIIPIHNKIPTDIHEEPKYQGQAILTIKNVPLMCKDDYTPVDPSSLREWFVFAVLEEDRTLDIYHDNIQNLKEKIPIIIKKLKDVSRMDFLNADGSIMSGTRLNEERKSVAATYAKEQKQIETELKAAELQLERQIQFRRRIGIKFIQISIDEKTQTSSWQVILSGVPGISFIEDQLVAKQDWSGIKLAQSLTNIKPPLPTWTGRSRVPPNYEEMEIKMGNCFIERVAHGLGSWNMLNRKSSRLSYERFGLYYGDWEYGKKSGQGMEIDDSGVYSGIFVDNYRSTQGRYDMADGTAIVGNFSKTVQTTKDQILSENLNTLKALDGTKV